MLRRSISLLFNVRDISLKHDMLQFLIVKACRYGLAENSFPAEKSPRYLGTSGSLVIACDLATGCFKGDAAPADNLVEILWNAVVLERFDRFDVLCVLRLRFPAFYASSSSLFFTLFIRCKKSFVIRYHFLFH